MPDETPTPPSNTQALLDYVAHREVPCPRCSYNLRGLTQPTCPECGNQLQLTVGSASPINRAWLTMIGALIAPAGIGVFGCVGLLMALQYNGLGDLFSPRSFEEGFALILVLYTILCVPLSITAIVLRRPFSRLPATAQVIGATIPCVIDITGFLFFLSMIS